MNSVQIIGNISTDIDSRVTPQGHHVATFNVAVASPYNREKTAFLRVETWRKQAENVSNYCQKGSKVGIVGHLEVDQYEKDGQKRSITKVVASNVEFLTPKNSQGGNQRQDQYSNQNQYQQGDQRQSDPFANNGQPIDISDDVLPF